MTWLVIQRPVCSSRIGPYQYGILSCWNGSISSGTRSKNQPTLRVVSSSTGTRHSKWPPVKRQFGQRQTRPPVGAVAIDQPEIAAVVLIKNQVLAEQPDRLGRLLVQLALRGEGHPVA